MSSTNEGTNGTRRDAAARRPSHELRFVEVGRQSGGWYRELPDAQIEVFSRAHLERVRLAADESPEAKAKEVIADILAAAQHALSPRTTPIRPNRRSE